MCGTDLIDTQGLEVFRKSLGYGSQCTDDYWYDDGFALSESFDLDFQILVFLDLFLFILDNPCVSWDGHIYDVGLRLHFVHHSDVRYVLCQVFVYL